MYQQHLDIGIATVLEEDKADMDGNRWVIVQSVDQIEEVCKQININCRV